MSVNYHAFQSRGVPFAEYEKVCQQWQTGFSAYDPVRIAGILNLAYDEAWLYLCYFGCPYRLCLADGHLEKKKDENWTDELYFNESMAIYHLLHYTKDKPRTSGVWVPSHTIDGVVSRSRAMDPLLDPFAQLCTGRTAELAAACEALGGQRMEKGDLSFRFEAFPWIPMQLVFWDADEDFPAQAQVLVDQSVTDFIHYETVGCIISDLLEKLEKNLKKPEALEKRYGFAFLAVKMNELEKVMQLYTEARGREFCVWTEDYPSIDHIKADIEQGGLFCLKDSEGNILGCIAKDRDPVVDALPFWSKEYVPAAEVARVVVAEGHENQGIARELVRRMMVELKSQGYKGIHYLVAEENIPALRAYRTLGFKMAGETNLSGIHYLCYEHPLAEDIF